MFWKSDVPERWRKIGLKKKEDVLNAINEAYSNREKIGLNVCLGKWNDKNICMTLNEEEKIVDAFPAAVDIKEYQKIEGMVREFYKSTGVDADDVAVKVVSLFIGIDIMNNKQDFLNGKYNKVNCRLFTCTADDDIVVIPTEQGSIAIGMQIVKDIVSKEL